MTKADWKAALRNERRAAQKFAKYRTQAKWEQKKRMRNEATKQRRIAIRAYWEKKTKELNSNPRAFYKAMKPFIASKKKGVENSVLHFSVNGSILGDRQTEANVIAEYFATMADDIGGRHTRHLTEKEFTDHPSVLSIAQNLKREDFFEFRTISKAEIEEALKNLNPNKAAGCDLIPPKTLKLAASELAPSPTELFNEVIAQGSISYPIMWKKGDWVTVHKKDDKMDKVNYRPGTVLNAVNKVFEQQLSKQITEI